MNKRLFRKKGILLISIASIVLIIVVAMIVNIMKKDAVKDKDSVQTEQREETPQEQNDEEPKAQFNIEETIAAKWEEVENAKGQPEFLQKINDNASYEIKTIEEKEKDFFLVTVECSAPNLGKSLRSMSLTEMMHIDKETEMNEFLCKKVAGSPIEKKTASVYVYIKEGECEVVFSDIFVDTMSGGLYEYSQEVMVDVLESSGDVPS